ncbi:hypothetical protein RIF29_12978 [Crotalaria pallida]|uniref:Uncharacterized protein n=1 Tax=Crotalaria pallida TaxID=3830 RepID=A0AAN9IP11_CROPI
MFHILIKFSFTPPEIKLIPLVDIIKRTTTKIWCNCVFGCILDTSVVGLMGKSNNVTETGSKTENKWDDGKENKFN